MALTERYVSVAGGGLHDGTSEANAFTFAEMITDMATPRTGYRYNMKSGAYSSGAVSLTAGTFSAPNVIRGYNSTIADLNNQGLNADGTLNTTNFPVLTLTGSITPAASCVLQYIDITGSITSGLVHSAAVDDMTLDACRLINTENHSLAKCIRLDDRASLINCECACTGASHDSVVEVDLSPCISGCRFKGTESGKSILNIKGGSVERTVFFGGSGANGIALSLGSGVFATSVVRCTFYAIGTCIEVANTAPAKTGPLVLMHNHATDCSKWIDNLYSGTANISTLEIRNRLRDITTPRTGIEAIVIGEISTDTGGPETDYSNAGANDFHLITSAPGYNAGWSGEDIGALQTDPPAGGSNAYVIGG